MANACGPCIGQWKRETDDPTRKNSIVTSFNRNFAKRADGNPNTYAFVASPELTMALTIAGDLCFNPLKDRLVNHNGEKGVVRRPCSVRFRLFFRDSFRTGHRCSLLRALQPVPYRLLKSCRTLGFSIFWLFPLLCPFLFLFRTDLSEKIRGITSMKRHRVKLMLW